MGQIDDTRPFPIQSDYKNPPSGKGPAIVQNRSHVPWWLAEIAYEEYKANFGDSQSLERIAERGGFEREELIALIRKTI